MQDDMLLSVNKPGRYIGNEWNLPAKDFANAEIKFALGFADLYEVGMSNLGLRILYGLLNNLDNVSCERFFSPAEDMEGVLRKHHLPLESLESQQPLKNFDFIGFSLGHELCYTNLLNILDLAGIPLNAELRDVTFPLVIAGGPSTLNPEPLVSFFDLFVIGEAEEAILEILELYRGLKVKFKNGLISKIDLLTALASIEGVYVPCLYEVSYGRDGKIEDFIPKVEGVPRKIKKRFVKDLNNAYFPSRWLVPYIQTVHDRVTIEIMRGCPHHCRFCQARSQYFPLRIRNPSCILNLTEKACSSSGYEEVSLSGLSVSDYPQSEELVKAMMDTLKQKGVSLSLPSIKPTVGLSRLSNLISTFKKTTLTFAPEAGTERLRRVLNKDFDTIAFFKTLEELYHQGYQHIKLYFMVGIPSEEKQDLEAIADFSQEVSRLRKRLGFGNAQVNISVNPLIPKPHTPFQWLKVADLEELRLKQIFLRERIKGSRLKLNFHNRYLSYLEGVFSRGDRRLGKVIESAFNKGARFDGWAERLRFDIWQEAFKDCAVEPDFYLKEKSPDELLPWGFIDVGIAPELLRQEFNNILL